jgi:ribosomal protein S28E/S33
VRTRVQEQAPAGSGMAARIGMALVCVLDDPVALTERRPFVDDTSEAVSRPHRGPVSVGELIAHLVDEALTTITSPVSGRVPGVRFATTATDLPSAGPRVVVAPVALLAVAGLLGPDAVRVVVTTGRRGELRDVEAVLGSGPRSQRALTRTVVVVTGRPETAWCRAQLVVLGGLSAGVITAGDLHRRRGRARTVRDLIRVLSTLPAATWPVGSPDRPLQPDPFQPNHFQEAS